MDQQTLRQRLLTSPILPLMLRQALPVIAVLSLQTLVGVAETFYVSFLGTEALAGAITAISVSVQLGVRLPGFLSPLLNRK